MDAGDKVSVSAEDAQHRAASAFEQVFENGPKIELDHYVVYYARALCFYFSAIHIARWIEYMDRF